MMANINKFRPLNGGRSPGRNTPSFLVCALFIGLCIVTVSYYNLSSQYTKMYDGMTDLVKQQKLLETHLEKKKTEHLNEKLKEQKSLETLKETQDLLESKKKELDEANKLNTKARDEITKKAQELTDAQARIKELETLKTQLNEEIVKQKEQIDELNKKLFPSKSASDINLQDNKQGLDPKRKIVDNTLPLNQPNDSKDVLLKETKSNSKEEDKKPKNDRHDPIVNLLNKDKNSN